jgi:hypothetical protein
MTQQRARGAQDQADKTEECANCGHERRFHNGEDGAACTSPEDGTPCTCQGFKAA